MFLGRNGIRHLLLTAEAQSKNVLLIIFMTFYVMAIIKVIII